MALKCLPRWLISITPQPAPCQSSISSAAWRRTSSGSAAGPALKLNTRLIQIAPDASFSGVFDRIVAFAFERIFRVRLDDLLDAGQIGAFVQIDQRHALG